MYYVSGTVKPYASLLIVVTATKEAVCQIELVHKESYRSLVEYIVTKFRRRQSLAILKY